MNKKQVVIFNIVIIIAIILLTISVVQKTFQEDTFYMIKVGEYICENGIRVIEDRIEPFGFVIGLIYTYPHWLLDIVFYKIYSAFSFAGIYIFTVLSGIIIHILIYYTNVRVTKNYFISAIIAILGIYFLNGFIAARAQIITFICLILEILFIERFLKTGKGIYIIGLILDPIILANCHAALFPIYFVIFLPYITEYIISLIFKKSIYNRKRIYKKIGVNKIGKIIIEHNKRTKWLIIIFIICIFTGLITPIKDIPYTYMIKSIQGNTMNFISEHQPVILIHHLSLSVIFVIISILMFSNKIKIKLHDLFMIIGMSILALISYKQFPIFFICTMCIINKLILMFVKNMKIEKEVIKKAKEEIEHIRRLEYKKSKVDNTNEIIEEELRIEQELYEIEERLKNKKKRENILKKIKNIPKNILSVKGMVYPILIILIIMLTGYRNIIVQNYVDEQEYPVKAAEWINENLDKENMRLYNDFNYGSYLLFKDIKVFIDGRADVYDPKFNGKEEDSYLAYMLSSSMQVWYEDVFHDYDITHIITKNDSTLNMVLEKNTNNNMLYNDGNFVIYEV